MFALAPRFVATLARRAGFSAAFSAGIAHDAAAGPLGTVGVSGATGPVTLVGGTVTGRAGDAGGRFDVTASGGSVAVAFDRAGLGAALAPGEGVTTATSVTLSDGATQIAARLAVTVTRLLRAPALLAPFPDRTDALG